MKGLKNGDTEEIISCCITRNIFSVVMEYCSIFIRCYVSGEIKKVHMGRLLLCEAVAMILERSFHILGLKPVERM
jgi:arginyl-tRNA synthetase